MRHGFWLGLLASPLLPRLAAAEPRAPSDKGEQPAASAEAAKPAEAPSYGHGRQFGLRAGVVGGYRMIFRYDSSPFCREPDLSKQLKDQSKSCGHAAPFAGELAVSFAPLDAIEPFLFGRFGFQREEQTDTDPLMAFGAGLRIYTMSDSAFKIFIEPAVGAELEGGGDEPKWKLNDPDYKKDFLFHIAVGPHYDFAKNVGVFVDAGLTTGILRAIHSTLEFQAGLQLRAP